MTSKLEEWRLLACSARQVREALCEACNRVEELEGCLFQAQNAAIDLAKKNEGLEKLVETLKKADSLMAATLKQAAAELQAADELATAVDYSGVYKDCQNIADKLKAFRALLYPGIYKI